jgi:Concanavalin A-like lectin/glucanases superfamily/Thrombospondin type 3 repeat
MKRPLIALLLSSFSLSPVAAAATLTHQFDFEGSLGDSVAGSTDTLAFYAAYPSDPELASYSEVTSFDGSTALKLTKYQVLELQDDAGVLSGSFSVSLWYRPDPSTPSAFAAIVFHSSTLFLSEDLLNTFAYGVKPASGYGADWLKVRSVGLFTNEVWTHLTYTADEDTGRVSLYQDGVLISSLVASVGWAATNRVDFGGYIEEGAWAGSGVGTTFDKIQIFDGALDADEVLELYTGCPYGDVDTDGDGYCDGDDRCPDDALNDSDGDGVCAPFDVCEGGDDSSDTDLDGTPDACDACPLDVDDDSDGDGICDSDDPCPDDTLDDSDIDGSCDSDELCIGDDGTGDTDGDGFCDDIDDCEGKDYLGDSDGDDVCDDLDICAGDDDLIDDDWDGRPDCLPPLWGPTFSGTVTETCLDLATRVSTPREIVNWSLTLDLSAAELTSATDLETRSWRSFSGIQTTWRVGDRTFSGLDNLLGLYRTSEDGQFDQVSLNTQDDVVEADGTPLVGNFLIAGVDLILGGFEDGDLVLDWGTVAQTYSVSNALSAEQYCQWFAASIDSVSWPSTDGDGICDSDDVVDFDLDGVMDDCDACPYVEGGDPDGDGICGEPDCSDGDGDGVCDAVDACPLGDDGVDGDDDGTADACDACPVDVYNDSDGDGACDSDDICALDAQDDEDGDGTCADADPCPLDADDDLDLDGVCGDVDACPMDPYNDADGDGICGNVDACAGGDDADDSDGDLVADACDVCPFDDANDADADGACADDDICPLDADDDLDGDGLCSDEDICPLDADNDADLDDMCADVDPCPVDVENDADGDGICEATDNCPTTANSDQGDSNGDGEGDVCEPDADGDGVYDSEDNCPLVANTSQADSDGDGAGDACDTDADSDSVPDDLDVCAGTAAGAATTDDGCSIDQACPCDATWKNHGAYQSCVSNTTTSMVTAGALTDSQRTAIVSATGASSCGKKK